MAPKKLSLPTTAPADLRKAVDAINDSDVKNLITVRTDCGE
jgi:acyl CoA:acetate/3-ketoacid CoA transferase alpha subunit